MFGVERSCSSLDESCYCNADFCTHTLKSSFPGYITAGRPEFLDFQKYLAVALIVFNFSGMAY